MHGFTIQTGADAGNEGTRTGRDKGIARVRLVFIEREDALFRTHIDGVEMAWKKMPLSELRKS